ncbi:MAG: HD domain-containing protein [Elusimicrobia bacterium]|nr:HD domain-containing protein [Elusimicrobiota bacterium]
MKKFFILLLISLLGGVSEAAQMRGSSKGPLIPPTLRNPGTAPLLPPALAPSPYSVSPIRAIAPPLSMVRTLNFSGHRAGTPSERLFRIIENIRKEPPSEKNPAPTRVILDQIFDQGHAPVTKTSTSLIPERPEFRSEYLGPSHIPDVHYGRMLRAGAEILLGPTALSSQELQEEQTRQNLLEYIRSKDDRLYGHVVRTGLLAGLITLALGHSMTFAQKVSWGARFHDIGQTNSLILFLIRKERKLLESERLAAEFHPEEGASIIRQMGNKIGSAFQDVAFNVVLYHHERMDGTGYPIGLKGPDIPIEARIVALADHTDALMEHRRYRPGMTLSEAFAILLGEAHAGLDQEALKKLLFLVRYFTTSPDTTRFTSHQ